MGAGGGGQAVFWAGGSGGVVPCNFQKGPSCLICGKLNTLVVFPIVHSTNRDGFALHFTTSTVTHSFRVNHMMATSSAVLCVCVCVFVCV